jgi:prepilin-type N-terminal cleavage/methylation domain-containing protein
MKKNVIKKINGFTLFELLVSISIIGIMTALATVSYAAAQKKARDARRVEDIKAVQVAAEQYYSQNAYVYPVNGSTTLPWKGGGQDILSAFPLDPKNDFNSGYQYSYTPVSGSAAGSSYCVCAKVEDPTNNGNSTKTDCSVSFISPGATATYYCAKNQQ